MSTRRRLLAGLALVLGCASSHPRADADAGEPLDARRDAPGLRDASCVPVREHVSRACDIAWARTLGRPPEASTSQQVQRAGVHADTAVASFWLAPTARLDALELAARVTVGFGPDGRARWARSGLLGALFGTTAWIVAQDGGRDRLDRVTVADGVIVASQPLPAETNRIAVERCEACEPRLLPVLSWRDRLDLGSLGTRTGPRGDTLALFVDGIARWDATVIESAIVPAWFPVPIEVRTDGTSVAVWHPQPWTDSDVRFCPGPPPCSDESGWRSAVLVEYAADGTPLASVVGPAIARWTGARLAGGDVIASDFSSVLRMDPSGAPVWSRAAGEIVEWLAVDEAREVVWAGVRVDGSGTTSLGTTVVGDCFERGIGATTLVARFDLATGALVDVRLPAEGLDIEQAHVTDAGRLFVVGHTHTDGDLARVRDRLELCGTSLEAEAGVGVEIVIAEIE